MKSVKGDEPEENPVTYTRTTLTRDDDWDWQTGRAIYLKVKNHAMFRIPYKYILYTCTRNMRMTLGRGYVWRCCVYFSRMTPYENTFIYRKIYLRISFYNNLISYNVLFFLHVHTFDFAKNKIIILELIHIPVQINCGLLLTSSLLCLLPMGLLLYCFYYCDRYCS